MANRTALLIIDAQQGLIDGFEDDWAEALPAIADLVDRARRAGAPVVWVQHCGQPAGHPLHRSQAGWNLHPGFDVGVDDLRVTKTWSDAFRDTDLDDLLRNAAASRVVLAGAQTEYCVDTTARRALSLGYDVDLVADGHTTSGNGVLTREQIISHHNATLAGLATDGVDLNVAPCAEITFTAS